MTRQDALTEYFRGRLERQKKAEDKYIDAESLFVSTAVSKLFRELSTRLRNQGYKELTKADVLKILERIRQECLPFKQSLETRIAKTSAYAFERSIKSVYLTLSIDKQVPSVKMVAGLDLQEFTEIFRKISVGGCPLSNWIDTAFDKPSIDKIKDETLKGLVEYRTYPQVAAALSDCLPATRIQVDTVVRTYMHTAVIEGHKRVYQENQDIIKELQWSSTRDEGVCITCAWLDDQRFPINDAPPCPAHPRCRCLLVPVVHPGGFQSVPLSEQADVPTVQEWFEEDDKRLQVLLGPNRYALLKAGKISFDDLVDKETLKIKTLEALLPGQDVKEIIAKLKDNRVI